MRTLTALLHSSGPKEDGYWATCLEVAGANGQGETKQECLEDLSEAVKLMLEVIEQQALREDPHAEKLSLFIA